MTFNSSQHSASYRILSCLLCIGMLVSGHPALSQVVLPTSVTEGRTEKQVNLSFRDAPLDVVLQHYAELTGRTIIKSPGVPQVLITLKNQKKFTESKSLVAIESILAMHNIALVPLGEDFLKVIPIAELRTHGMEINKLEPDSQTPDTDTMESRIFELDHLTMADIQPILDGLKHSYGKIQVLERTNGFLMTDTAANLKRIADIVDYLDTALQTRVETRIYELHNAEAANVAARLNELIQDSQERQQQQPQPVRRRTGAVRPRGAAAPGTAPASPTTGTGSEQDLAERGIVQGNVKIVADERTNIMIVISRPSNFAFFDKIVSVLDKEIEQEVAVDVVVVPLEYAAAEDVAGILNDFVGVATQDQEETPGSAQSGSQADQAQTGRSTALQDYVRRRLEAARTRASRNQAGQETDSQNAEDLGRLSPNTRILADQRTNSLLLMGRNQDIAILQGVIDDLDVMLSQVLIEAVILEVNLSDSLQHGVNWLQRSFTVNNEETIGPGGGLTVQEPVFGFGGGQRLQDGLPFLDGSQIDREVGEANVGAGALTYYGTFFDLNLDAVVRLAASSSDAQILSTPVVVTTDNTEARILVGESRPVVTSTSTTAGGVGRNTFQYQEIGISLDVTPRINPKNFVVMEITQTADNVGGFEVIDGNNVPIITRREMQAQIAVKNKGTIALGGLISSDNLRSESKVPLLGDIPILGNLFRFENDSDNRTELLVLITPYVMSTPSELFEETKRLRDRSFTDGETWEGTWSDSPLVLNANPNTVETRERKSPDTPKGIMFSRKKTPSEDVGNDLPMVDKSKARTDSWNLSQDEALETVPMKLPIHPADVEQQDEKTKENQSSEVSTNVPIQAAVSDQKSVDDLTPAVIEVHDTHVTETDHINPSTSVPVPNGSGSLTDLLPTAVPLPKTLDENPVVGPLVDVDANLPSSPSINQELSKKARGTDKPASSDPISADELDALMKVDFYSDHKPAEKDSYGNKGLLVIPFSAPTDVDADGPQGGSRPLSIGPFLFHIPEPNQNSFDVRVE